MRTCVGRDDAVRLQQRRAPRCRNSRQHVRLGNVLVFIGIEHDQLDSVCWSRSMPGARTRGHPAPSDEHARPAGSRSTAAQRPPPPDRSRPRRCRHLRHQFFQRLRAKVPPLRPMMQNAARIRFQVQRTHASSGCVLEHQTVRLFQDRCRTGALIAHSLLVKHCRQRCWHRPRRPALSRYSDFSEWISCVGAAARPRAAEGAQQDDSAARGRINDAPVAIASAFMLNRNAGPQPGERRRP